MELTLKDYRKKAQLTQTQAAAYLQVSLRTYKTYENDPKKINTNKHKYMLQELANLSVIDETHGILTIDEIKERCTPIFREANVNYCYLFGSYAKETATPISDIDFLIDVNLKGLKFYGLIERVKNATGKNVDVLNSKQLQNNFELMNEILKEGIKIYG